MTQNLPTPRREFTRPAVLAAIGCWVGFLVGPNVMIASTNSVFMKPLIEAFDANRTSISLALALQVWLVAFLVPLSGRAMDRFGPRAVVLPGALLLGLFFFACSRVTSIWQYAAVLFLISIPASMHSSVGYAKVISTWFDRNRGLVLGLCVALGAGIGQTIMPKLSQYLISTYDWRVGYMTVAGIILLGGLPVIWLLVRTNKDGARTAEQMAALPGVSRSEALRQRVFYQVFFAIMFGSMSLLGTLQHSVPMLTERGLDPGSATTVLSLSFIGVILGEFTSGFLVDRFNTPRIILPFFVIAWIGLMMVHTLPQGPLLLLGGVMLGLGLGGEIGQNAYMVSRYFGLRVFGSIYGLTFAASNLGIGIGLIVMGRVRDMAGSYDPMRYVFGVTMLISVLCIATLPPFRFKAERAH